MIKTEQLQKLIAELLQKVQDNLNTKKYSDYELSEMITSLLEEEVKDDN